ncbi:MAG: indole-3-glycerol phosphate synthase TrpC [Candidatus Binataceae bacterium]
MSSILDKIFAAKREELSATRARISFADIRKAAEDAPAARDFVAALRAHRPAIIAEVKRASPSKGDIFPGLDPAAVARDYATAGAACVSVLTGQHFKGSLEDLRAVRAAVDLPLLRKDFMFDPYQVYEARAAGADCILLIAAMLSDSQMHELRVIARELGMAALVEIHSDAEFDTAQKIGATLLGINNRDLHTFVTDIAVTERLLASHGNDALIVSESGIDSPADIVRLDNAGAAAFLIGESLLRGGKPQARLAELMGSLKPKEARISR